MNVNKYSYTSRIYQASNLIKYLTTFIWLMNKLNLIDIKECHVLQKCCNTPWLAHYMDVISRTVHPNKLPPP